MSSEQTTSEFRGMKETMMSEAESDYTKTIKKQNIMLHFHSLLLRLVNTKRIYYIKNNAPDADVGADVSRVDRICVMSRAKLENCLIVLRLRKNPLL